LTNYLDGQDMMAWVTQGGVAQRDKEHLGQSDIGVILYREMLREQMERVERGEEPSVEIYRDLAQNVRIDLPCEGMRSSKFYPGYSMRAGHMKFSPRFNEVADLFQQAEAHVTAGKEFLPRIVPPLIPWGGEQRGYHREAEIVPLDRELHVAPGSYARPARDKAETDVRP
jgi:Rieske oxygenase family protein